MTPDTLYTVLACAVTAMVVAAFMHWKARQKPGAIEAELMKLADDAVAKMADTSGLMKVRDAAQSQLDARRQWLEGLPQRVAKLNGPQS